MKKLLILPGDGIGPEIGEAVLPLFEQLALPLALEMGEIGWGCWQRTGNAVPEKTWQQIEQADAVLLGTVTDPDKKTAEATLSAELRGQGSAYISPLIQLEQRLGLFAQVRPAQHLLGHGKPFRCCVIHGNTSIYADLNHHNAPKARQNLLQHPHLAQNEFDLAAANLNADPPSPSHLDPVQLFRYAFEYAKQQGYSRLTFADESKVTHDSSYLLTDTFYSIAKHYPTIAAEIQPIDALTVSLVRQPEAFGVIVANHKFGPMLADLTAEMMGGIGIAASAKIGEKTCYFAPAHGSAPEMAGKNRANPSAMFLAVALALRHLGFGSEASRIEQAVRSIILKRRHLTYDLSGQTSLRSMARAILEKVAHPQPIRQASVLCIGDELLRGQNSNTNAQAFAQRLSEAQYEVNLQMVCGDQPASIRQALEICLSQADLIIVNGGLGPTSDDVTREAVAATADVPLELDEASWLAIQARLHGFGLKVVPSNRRQAFFPRGAKILPNPNGTAPGFTLTIYGRTIHVLPGPPKECLPMLEALLARAEKENLVEDRAIYHWRLLGVVESDIAQIVDEQLADMREQADVSYLCSYPHVNIRIAIPARKQQALAEKIAKLESLFKDHLISKQELTALEQLGTYLGRYSLVLEDTLTQQVFAQRIVQFTPHFETTPSAANISPPSLSVKASSLDSLGPPFQGSVLFECSVALDAQRHDYTMRAPKRGPEIIESACEFIAWSIVRSCQSRRLG